MNKINIGGYSFDLTDIRGQFRTGIAHQILLNNGITLHITKEESAFLQKQLDAEGARIMQEAKEKKK